MKSSGLVYLIPLTILTSLAASVVMHRTIFFDVPMMQFIGGLRAPSLTKVLEHVTSLGGTAAILAAVAGLAAVLIFKRKHRELIFVAAGVLGAGLLSALLKLIFARERPAYLAHLVAEGGYSFPSGHGTASSALAIACLFLLWNTRWRWIALGVGSAYALAVGASRVYLGVHYPSDVVAGWCVSCLWVGIVAYWIFTRPHRTSPSP